MESPGGASEWALHSKRTLAAVYSKDPFRFIVLAGLGFLALVFTVLLLLHQPYSLANQPFPDAHEYLDAANRLAHGHGYTTTVRDNAFSPHLRQAVNPPRYSTRHVTDTRPHLGWSVTIPATLSSDS